MNKKGTIIPGLITVTLILGLLTSIDPLFGNNIIPSKKLGGNTLYNLERISENIIVKINLINNTQLMNERAQEALILSTQNEEELVLEMLEDINQYSQKIQLKALSNNQQENLKQTMNNLALIKGQVSSDTENIINDLENIIDEIKDGKHELTVEESNKIQQSITNLKLTKSE